MTEAKANAATGLKIALHGLAGSGKSTVARFVRNQLWHSGPHPFPFEPAYVLSFATPLKQIVSTAFPFLTMELLMDPQRKEVPMPELGGHTPGQVMQCVEKAFREFLPPLLPQWEALQPDQKVFTRNLLLRTEQLQKAEPTCMVIVDDFEMKDEIRALRDAGFITIHVTRGKQKEHTVAAEQAAIHPTEAGNLPCDFTVCNDGTISELFHKVNVLMRQLSPGTPSFVGVS